MKKNNQFKLDFIGIGFPRCGTTWVCRNLENNPKLDFSKYKEMHYFLTNKSEIFKNDNKFKKLRPKTFEEYTAKFKNNGLPKGEFSVHYIFDKHALKKIKDNYPNIKVILCVRDPIEYLESAYNFIKSSHIGYKISDNMLDAIINAPAYEMYSVNRARFNKYINEANKIFGNNLKIIRFEDIVKNKTKVLKDLYEFLNVEYDENNFILKKVNKSLAMRNKTAMRVIEILTKVIKKTPFKKVLFTLVSKENIIQNIFNKVFKTETKKKHKLTLYERKKLKELLNTD